MKQKAILFVLAIFFFVLLNNSCKKEPVDLTSPVPILLSIAKSGPSITIPDAMKNSSNNYAQKVVQTIDSINAMSRFLSYFNVPLDAKKIKTDTAGISPLLPGSGTWTWKAGEYNVRYEVLLWDSVWNNFYIYLKKGADAEHQYLFAREKRDLSSGILYLDGSWDKYYSWRILSASSIDYVEKTHQYWPNAYQVTINSDESGTATQVDIDYNRIEIYWTVDGKSGTWSRFCADCLHSLVDSGAWTAK